MNAAIKREKSPRRTARPVRRSPQNTTLTISMPLVLTDAIRELAASDGRNVSEWIRVNLAKIADMDLSQL